MIQRREFLKRFAVLTGSIAFGVGRRNSDEDWLVHANDAKELGITGIWNPSNEYTEGFHSFREGNVNVIVCHSQDFKDRWMRAHRHCVIERPRSKARRVKIFRHYLYGDLL